MEKGTPKYDCAEGSGSTGPLMVRVFVGGGLVPADLATWDGDLAGDGPWVWHDKLVWIDWYANWMDGTWGWIYKSDWWQGFGNGLIYGAYTPLVATGTYSDTLLEWTEQYVGWGQWHVQLELDEEGRMSTKVEHRWDPEGLSEGKAAFKMTGLVKQAAP